GTGLVRRSHYLNPAHPDDQWGNNVPTSATSATSATFATTSVTCRPQCLPYVSRQRDYRVGFVGDSFRRRFGHRHRRSPIPARWTKPWSRGLLLSLFGLVEYHRYRQRHSYPQRGGQRYLSKPSGRDRVGHGQ